MERKEASFKIHNSPARQDTGRAGSTRFKGYFWSFVLRPLSTWLNPSSLASWRPIEENLSLPHRLQDLVYSNIPLKKAKLRLGPIISFLLVTYRTVMKQTHAGLKWHNHSPIFNNFSLLSGNIPFSFPQWKSRGVNILKDMYGDSGLRAFNDLHAEYDLPGSSFFFYLQLRSAMRACGVPWGLTLPTHPLQTFISRSCTA